MDQLSEERNNLQVPRQLADDRLSHTAEDVRDHPALPDQGGGPAESAGNTCLHGMPGDTPLVIDCFEPGTMVECIDDNFPVEARLVSTALPGRGKIYTVRETMVCRNHGDQQFGLGLRLQELRNPSPQFGMAEPFWAAARFRPVNNPAIMESRPALQPHPASDPSLLCQVAGQVARFRELQESCPGLAACILWLEDWESCKPADIPQQLWELAGQKRRRLCSKFGFPATPAVQRLFTNWDLPLKKRLSNRTWLLQTRMLLECDAEAHALLARLVRPTLSEVGGMLFGGDLREFILLAPSQLPRARWFFELPLMRRHFLAENWSRLLHDFAIESLFLPRLRSLGSFAGEKKAFAYLQCRRQTCRRIRQWIDELGTGRAVKEWVEPPLRGTDHIRPINSIEELQAEGRELRHCIADYATKILLGQFFAYRMLAPLRCTVGLVRRGQHWALKDMRGMDNHRVRDEQAIRAVQQWITTHPARTPEAGDSPIFQEIAARLGRQRIQVSTRGPGQSE